MPYRNFIDRAGVPWQVWDVTPGKLVNESLQGGWLTFESAGEKRRLAPVPLYWLHAPEEELTRLLDEARVVPPR